MENRDDLFNRIPFYMTYPMQNLYLMEMEYEKDMERMKELYPREVRQLQEMIERRCDELEYEGSRIYDENPDRRMLDEEACRLYERFIRENPQYEIMMPPRSDDMRPGMPMPRPDEMRPGMPMPRPDEMRPSMPMNPRTMPRQNMQMQEYRMDEDLEATQYRRGDQWLQSLIGILFHDEIYRRRCRHRRCRRWW